MNISIVTTGQTLQSTVPAKLAQGTYLFIVDVDQFAVTQVLPGPTQKRDVFFAQQTVEHNCEAILCGEIEQEAFEILANASVSRFDATGETPTQAVKKMNASLLPTIRDYKDGPGCAGERSGGACHEQNEDA